MADTDIELRLNSIVLPAGVEETSHPDQYTLLVTVYLTPRVVSAEAQKYSLGDPRLSAFRKWPDTSANLAYEFVLTNKTNTKSIKLTARPTNLPGSQKEADPSFQDIWELFFDDATEVATFPTQGNGVAYEALADNASFADVNEAVGKKRHTIESLSLATLKQKIYETYAEIASLKPSVSAAEGWTSFTQISRQNRPLIERFVQFGKVDGNVSSPTQGKPASPPANSGPPAEASSTETNPAREFHARLATLGDYPDLLRKLGLVLDFKITVSAEDIDDLNWNPSAANSLVCNISHADLKSVSPPTACIFDSNTAISPALRFRAANNATNPNFKLDQGLLKLDDHTAIQIDVISLGIQSYNADGQSAPKNPRAPAPRSSGLALVKGRASSTNESRADHTADRLNTFNDKPDKLLSYSDNSLPLYAEDLVKGYAVDIAEVRNGKRSPWKSLCLRNGKFSPIDSTPITKSGKPFETILFKEREAPVTLSATRAPQPVMGVVLAVYPAQAALTALVLSPGGVVWIQIASDKIGTDELEPGDYRSFSGTLHTDNSNQGVPANNNQGYDAWLEADSTTRLCDGVSGCLMSAYDKTTNSFTVAAEENYGWVAMQQEATHAHSVYYDLKNKQDPAARLKELTSMQPGGLFVAWGTKSVFLDANAPFPQPGQIFTAKVESVVNSSIIQITFGQHPVLMNVSVPAGRDIGSFSKGDYVRLKQTAGGIQVETTDKESVTFLEMDMAHRTITAHNSLGTVVVYNLDADAHLDEAGADDYYDAGIKRQPLDWLAAQLSRNQKLTFIGNRTGTDMTVWKIQRNPGSFAVDNANELVFIHDVKTDETTYKISGMYSTPTETPVSITNWGEMLPLFPGRFRTTLPINRFVWVRNNGGANSYKAMMPLPADNGTTTVWGKVADDLKHLQTAFGNVLLPRREETAIPLAKGQCMQLHLQPTSDGIKVIEARTVYAGHCDWDDGDHFQLREIGGTTARRLPKPQNDIVATGKTYKAVVELDENLNAIGVKVFPLQWFGAIASSPGGNTSVYPDSLDESCWPFIHSSDTQTIHFSKPDGTSQLTPGTLISLNVAELKLVAQEVFCTPTTLTGMLVSFVYSPDNTKLGAIVRWCQDGDNSSHRPLYDFFVPKEEFDLGLWELEKGVSISMKAPSNGGNKWLSITPATLPDISSNPQAPNYKQLPNSEQWVVTESYFHWQGWSLGVPRPGKSHWEPSNPQDARPPGWKSPQEIAKLQAKETRPPLMAEYEVPSGSLPRLRFGSEYRIRMRAIDLAGNCVPLDAYGLESQPDFEIGLTHNNQDAAYWRFEPVPPPVPAPISTNPREQADAGQSVKTEYYIRSYADSSKQKEPCDTAEFFLFPPEISFSLAECHGMFDADNPQQRHPWLQDPETSYRLLKQIDQRKTELLDKHKFKFELDPGLLPYLPDPFARSTAFNFVRHPFLVDKTNVFYPKTNFESRRSFYRGYRWPGITPMRVRLENGAGKPYWDLLDFGLLHVPVLPGYAVELQVSSLFEAAELENMGIWHLTSASMEPAERLELKKKILQGQHPMMTPSRTLSFFHAVTQPLRAPEFKHGHVTSRTTGSNVQKLSATISYEPMSTGELSVVAAWEQYSDDVQRAFPSVPDQEIIDQFDPLLESGSPSWKEILNILEQDRAAEMGDDPQGLLNSQTALLKAAGIPQTGYLAQVLNVLYPSKAREAIVSHHPVSTPVEWAPPPDNNQVTKVSHVEGKLEKTADGPQTVWTAKTHLCFSQVFSDTRHYQAKYRPQASTRYRNYFPKCTEFNHLEGDQWHVSVLNTAPPAPPSIAYIMPIFRWASDTPRDFLNRTHNRHGGGLRVYLNRPWYSSGQGEKIGLVLPGKNMNKVPPELQQYITEWGFDPIRNKPSNGKAEYGLLKPESIISPKSEVHEWEFTIPGTNTRYCLPVVAHDVRFSPTRGLWYCDIVVNEGTRYLPFVKLSLVRCQPNSIEHAYISTPAVAHFMQLLPSRRFSLKTDLLDSTSFTVSLTGPFPTSTSPLPHSVFVRIECQQGSNPDDLTWRNVQIQDSTNQYVEELALTPVLQNGQTVEYRGVFRFNRAAGLRAKPDILDWSERGMNPVDFYNNRFYATILEYETFQSDNGGQKMRVYADRILLPCQEEDVK